MEDLKSEFKKSSGVEIKTVYGASGKLVLWTLKNLDLEKGISVLKDSLITKIALADAKRAPYGREAMKALKRSGLDEKMKPLLVYGENISQVSQYILSGNVEIGFSAKSVVMDEELAGKGKWKYGYALP